jgi:hypothetical protein
MAKDRGTGSAMILATCPRCVDSTPSERNAHWLSMSVSAMQSHLHEQFSGTEKGREWLGKGGGLSSLIAWRSTIRSLYEGRGEMDDGMPLSAEDFWLAWAKSAKPGDLPGAA